MQQYLELVKHIRDHGINQLQVETSITQLENGLEAFSFSSGIAACTAPFHALNHGDHVAISDTLYHPTMKFFAVKVL